MTAKLRATTQTTATKYPECDRLYEGGVEPGKVDGEVDNKYTPSRKPIIVR